MSSQTLEQRVAALESVVEDLRQRLTDEPAKDPWWRRFLGAFENDPDFEEGVRLGREYRESVRDDLQE